LLTLQVNNCEVIKKAMIIYNSCRNVCLSGIRKLSGVGKLSGIRKLSLRDKKANN